VDEPEVAACNAGDRGNGLGVGEVGGVEAEGASVAGEHKDQLLAGQRTVVVGEANAGGEGDQLVAQFTQGRGDGGV
jgi:hypothetical protein